MVLTTFDEDEFTKEKQVVNGEIDRNFGNPFYYLDRALKDKLYYKYPTRKNPLGTRESILTATTDKMRMIQSRYYVPNNTALVVTGDVKPEEVFKLAEQYFGGAAVLEVAAGNLFALVDALDAIAPGFGENAGMRAAFAVNGMLQTDWSQVLAPDAQIMLFPRVAGG